MARKRGNGEGSIYKDGAVWRGQVSIGRDITTGKLRRMSFSGKTRRDVQEKIAQALSEISTGTFVEPTSQSVREWDKTWLKDYKRGSIRPKTYESYMYIIDSYVNPVIGDTPLKDLRTDHIQKLLNNMASKGLSSRTIRYAATIIHSFLAQAVKNGIIARNVSDAITLPKGSKKQMRVLSGDEQKRLIEVCRNDRLGAAFILSLAAGLRRSECLAIRWKDINLDENYIQIVQSLVRIKNYEGDKKKSELVFQQPKTASSIRTIPIPPSVKAELENHKARQDGEKAKAEGAYCDIDLVFCTELGKPIEPRNFERKFKQLLEKANIPTINLHGLRHSFATRLLEENEHPKIVQEMLGHKSIQITLDTYSHVSKELKRNAADKLDKYFSDKNANSNGSESNE